MYMQNAGKSRKALIIGIIAAVVVLAAVLGIVLTQCTGDQPTATTTATETTGGVETYTLYWNADRELYDSKSEAGMSSRMPESDGYFHVRFILDGQEIVLKVADRKLINAIDIKDVMGLEFDENGIVCGVLDLDDMPLEKTAWQFYVQSFGGKTLKANSSSSLNGMELLLEGDDSTLFMDMSGKEGPLGTLIKPIPGDRIYAISNLAGELTHVFVYDRPNYMLTHEGECEHCGKTVTWYEWVKEDAIPLTTGHYQLQCDVKTAKQSNTEEDAKICLDLNGHRIDGGYGARVYAMFNVGCELAIMDTSEAKTGTIAAHGTNGEAGMCVWVRYGAFYLYDGILDGSDASSKKNGTTVAQQKGTFFYMYGGEIIGGTSKYFYNENNKTYANGMAGSLCVNSGGKFVMYDGVIRDGFAEGKITAWNTDGTPKTYQRGAAGNIFLGSDTVMEMYGGVIKNGKSTSSGGNIFLDGTAELTIDGGKIQGGQSMGKGKNGGSVYVSTKATVYLKSGSITGGTTRNGGGNIYMNGTLIMSGGYIGGGVCRNFSTGKVNEDSAYRNVFNVNGTIKMYGGVIEGGVQVTDTSATDNRRAYVGLATYATIYDEDSTKNLTLSLGAGGPVHVRVDNLRDSAKIGVSALTGIFTDPTIEGNVDNFVSDIEGADVLYYNNCLALGRLQCLCGSDEHFGKCDGTEQLWAPHTATTSLPNRDGYFYLISDVNASGTTYLRGDASVHTRLDLNGKSILGPSGKNRTYSLFENMQTYDENGVVIPNVEGVEMKLTVTDSVGTGKITMREHNDLDQGALFWGRHVDSEINIYGGTFDGSAATSTRHMGAVISAAGDLNIYGGTVIGGTSTSGGSIAVTGANSVFTMTGGTITGGTATGTSGGGNVILSKSGATFNFSGGTIENGTAMNGGNIYLAKGVIMNMSGGLVTGGRVDNSAIEMDGGLGGNIYQGESGTFTMTGGVIEKGYVRGGTKGGGHGGNLGYYGHVELLGGIIRDGQSHAAGGNVATIATNATIIMDGVRLENGKAGGNGGNFAVHVRNTKGVEIKGNTVITGGTAASGGNIAFRGGSSSAVALTATISDITLTGGTATSYGGNIYVYNDTTDAKAFETNLVLKNVILEDGSCGAQGGNIFFEGRGNLTIEDSNLTGGTARQGGNLFAYSKTAILKGSVIADGTAVKAGDGANGGNIFVGNKCDLQLIDTTVKDGVASGNTTGKYPTGGNVFINGGAKVSLDKDSVLSGGKIDQQVASWSAGANVYLSNGTLDINGGSITGGSIDSKGSAQGNNIHICPNGTVNLNSGKVENTAEGNQNIYVEGGTLNIKGGQIINTATSSRNISAKADVDGVVNMSGGEIVGGRNASGGNVYIPSSLVFNLSGGTVRDGKATSGSGGNFQVVANGTLNITGGEIRDGEAVNSAGNILVNGTVNMSGGTISGGKNTTSGANGGSVYLSSNGTFNLSGGTVKDGNSANIGGNFYINAATLNVSGDGYITGGTKGGAANSSGNIACVNGTLNISGGVIDGDIGATNSGRDGVIITMSGKVVINKGLYGGLYLSRYNYDYPATVTIDGTLAEGSHIVIKSVIDTVVTSNATAEENLKFFEALDAGKQLVWLTMDKDINGDGTNDLHKLAFGLTYCICGVESDDPADHLGTCGGEILTWLPWDKTDRLPTEEGNWYLTNNITYNHSSDSDAMKEFNKSGIINIDLNGKTVTTAKNLRIFRVRNGSETTNTHIALTDTSAAKTGKIVHTCTAGTLDGGIVWLTQATHSFSLYGGTLDASGLTCNTSGTAIKVNSGVVNIYGGSVIGGTISDDTINGAGIRVNAAATLNVEGGSISGGNGGNQGGAIAAYGTVNISGGSISGGSAKQGNNIAMIKSVASDPAKLTITGGNIAGDIYLNNAAGDCQVILSGKVVIEKGEKYGIYSATDMDVSGLTEGSKISVNAAGYFAHGANETIRGYFTTDLADTDIFLDGDKLFMGRESCLCGKLDGKCVEGACDGTVLRWTPWRSTTSLPATSGNYYLTGDVTGTGITLPDDTKLNLDLNGYTVTRSGRLYSFLNKSGIVLQITDNSAAQTGVIKASGKAGDQGFIWVTGSNNTMNLIRGTIDGTGRTLIRNSGLTLCVTSGNTFNMYGGSVIGGTYKYEASGTSVPYGGAAMRSAGTTNIYGGTIIGGTSDHLAGGIYVDGGVFTLAGGTIQGGKAANGGAVAINKGEFRLESGTITGGEATATGGNIYIDGGKFTMTGGTLTSGKGGTYGGNIHQAGGTVELLGGTVENGTVTSSATESGGGNIAANAADAVLTLNGVTVRNGSVAARGGNIYLYENGIDMTIKGNTVISGGTANYGANICLNAWERSATDRAVVTMDGGKISEGYARANAGAVYIYENYEFILNDGSIENGIAKGDGGNVYLSNFATTGGVFTMNGGSITGGEAGKDNTNGRNGGNLCVAANTTFNLNSGTVSGGKSNNSSGNIHVAGTMKMTDGTVKSGSAKNASSNNIAVQGGIFEMGGGEVEGHVTVVNSSATMDSKVIFSGEPVISGGTLGLKLVKVSPATAAPVISVKGTLGSKADIVISSEVSDGVIGDTTAGANAKAFSSQNAAKDVVKLDDGTLYLGKYGCICGGISGTDCAKDGHPKVKWTAWTSTTSTPGSGTSGTAGNYYLTGNITVTGDQHYPNANEVNIDLNGFNITGSGSRLFRLRNDSNSTVDYAAIIGIKNSRSGEGKGVISSTKQGAQEGYLIWMTQPSQVVNLYSGVLDGSTAKTVASKNGGSVAMSGGTFNMYGGELTGGNATGNGGNISVSDTDAVFNLYNGTVSDGNAVNGGNIYVVANATVNLLGGKVTGGDATTAGGNICLNGTLNLKGATVEKGTATSTGGNMIINSTGKLVMSKGLVTGGNAAGDTAKDHENIHCKFGTVELSGGQIDGYLFIQNFEASASTIKISGNPKVTGAAKNLILTWSKDAADTYDPLYPVIQLGKLTEGAKIGITASSDLFATGSSITEETEAFFTSDASNKQIVRTERGLELKGASEIWRCVCGGKAVGVGDHECVDVKWTETDTIPTTDGNYILTKSVEVPKQQELSGKTINIDLNGHEITVKSGVSTGRAFRLTDSTVLGITDSSAAGTGKIIGLGGNDSNPQGGVVVMSSSAKLNLYAGTITSARTYNSKSGGGVIYTTQAGTTFTMYGGWVTGGKSTAAGGNLWINSDSTFIMYGGKIDGGTSSGAKHSNIHLKFAHAEIYGGEIAGGFFVQNFNTSVSTIKIAGNPVIYGEGATYNLVLGWSTDNSSAANYPVAELGELTEGANIHVSDSPAGRVIAKPAGSYEITATDASYIKSDAANTTVTLKDGNLTIAAK